MNLFDDIPEVPPGIDYEADVEPEPQSEAAMTTKLGRVSVLAKLQIEAEQKVADLEDQLKAANKKLRRIQTEDFPMLMNELGLREVRLDNGRRVSVSRKLVMSLPKDPNRRAACAKWLVDHGLESLVQTRVSVKFDRGDGHEPERMINLLDEFGFSNVERSEDMNTSSVKSAVAKALASGEEVNLYDFGANELVQTVIR